MSSINRRTSKKPVSRSLMVNADDFGYYKKANEGIIAAYQKGIVTSTTLLVTMDGTLHALSLAKNCPLLDVGLHLDLTEGRPLTKGSTLVSTKGTFPSWFGLFFGSMVGRIKKEDIRKEVHAQLVFLNKHRKTISHVDGHRYVQLIPAVLEVLLEEMQHMGIKHLTWPKERLFIQVFGAESFIYVLKKLFVYALCFWNARTIQRARKYLTTNTELLGMLQYKSKNPLKVFSQYLSTVNSPGVLLMTHPGYADQNSNDYYTRNREKELKALTSAELASLIKKKGISLIRYRDLP